MSAIVDERIGSPDTAESDITARDLMRLPVDYAAPRNAVERSICAAFVEVMRISPIGRDDEFYDLGGDSLAGEALSIEIERATGQVFPISNLFRHGTPAAIAALIGGTAPVTVDPTRFFIVHGRGGYTSLKPEFRAGLVPDRNVTMFELPGIRGDRKPIWNIRDLAKAYVAQIQAEQPEGPVRLAAFCAGSFIALEMASVLREAGRPLDRIVLIDPLAPKELRVRHAAETALEQKPGSISPREYLRQTGRWRGSKFIDGIVVWFGQRRQARLHLQEMRDDKVYFVKKYQGLGFQDWPRAILMAMYRYTWPEPFAGRVYILASEERVRDIAAPKSIWRRFAPDVKITVVSHQHHELARGAAGTRVAKKLEEFLAPQP